MKIDFYRTYIDTITNSVWTRMFQIFWIDDTDIAQTWNLSCALYVSNILKIFGLIKEWHAWVQATLVDMQNSGWKPHTDRDTIPVWSILVRKSWFGPNGEHQHIWFFVWQDQAISNDSRELRTWLPEHKQYVPIQHHYTYDDTRDIDQIWTFDFDHGERQHYCRLPLVVYAQDAAWLAAQWANITNIDKRSVNNSACGAVCMHMILQQFGCSWVIDEILWYADIWDADFWYYKSWVWRWHHGIAKILQNYGVAAKVYTDTEYHKLDDPTAGLRLFQTCYDNAQYMICSVSKNFDIAKKWWHLVCVIGLKYDVQWYVICNDPSIWLQHIPYDIFVQCWTWGGIIVW